MQTSCLSAIRNSRTVSSVRRCKLFRMWLMDLPRYINFSTLSKLDLFHWQYGSLISRIFLCHEKRFHTMELDKTTEIGSSIPDLFLKCFQNISILRKRSNFFNDKPISGVIMGLFSAKIKRNTRVNVAQPLLWYGVVYARIRLSAASRSLHRGSHATQDTCFCAFILGGSLMSSPIIKNGAQ